MSHASKIAAFLALTLFLASISLAQATKPAFSAKDRELIETYYNHISGALAPGSLDRSAFSIGIEKALVPGSHIPMQLEKELMPLPEKLQLQLSPISGGYERYKLGRHIVLVKRADLEIADILKNIAVKETSK